MYSIKLLHFQKEPGKIHELMHASGTVRLEIISLEHQILEQVILLSNNYGTCFPALMYMCTT